MKRVLVYYEKSKMSPSGGPAGYLYNLYNGLLNIEKPSNIKIDFLETESAQFLSKSRKRLRKIPIIGNILHYFSKRKVSRSKINDIFFRKNNISKVCLNDYNIVHFHSCVDMYKARDSLKSYKGLVLLTSHTPKISHLEILDDLTKSDRKKYKKLLSNISIVDEYAFNNADYCIFPVEEALECYFNTWEPFKKIYEQNINKFKFVLTGTLSKQAKNDSETIRKKYGIPLDSFLISYVGRHNEIKGYDSLKRIGETILNKHQNVYFIVAGNEGPLFGLKNDRWIEVGWTNDAASIIKASNVFVLPNKETYFDLVMLEVMSIGKTVVCSNTGGNKFFTKLCSSGVILYNSEKDCVESLERLMKFDSKQLLDLEKQNKDLFDAFFTNEKFATNYVELYEKLLGSKEKL